MEHQCPHGYLLVQQKYCLYCKIDQQEKEIETLTKRMAGDKLNPDKLPTFMSMLMKTARQLSLKQKLDDWGITEEEYKIIKKWFWDELEIEL